jgi:hypothetical protein
LVQGCARRDNAITRPTKLAQYADCRDRLVGKAGLIGRSLNQTAAQRIVANQVLTKTSTGAGGHMPHPIRPVSGR